jgi:hypothetical protein
VFWKQGTERFDVGGGDGMDDGIPLAVLPLRLDWRAVLLEEIVGTE